jgi:hypothetical protein
MFLIWKSPTQNTGRMYFTLGQHYKFNTMRWNNEERKEFLHWEETFKKQFGESKNLSDMYKANPTETIKHIREKHIALLPTNGIICNRDIYAKCCF